MADRTPPVWTHADADYYGSEGVCRKCGKPMEVGQAYWLDRSMMIREPVPPFHAQCPGAARNEPRCPRCAHAGYHADGSVKVGDRWETAYRCDNCGLLRAAAAEIDAPPASEAGA